MAQGLVDTAVEVALRGLDPIAHGLFDGQRSVAGEGGGEAEPDEGGHGRATEGDDTEGEAADERLGSERETAWGSETDVASKVMESKDSDDGEDGCRMRVGRQDEAASGGEDEQGDDKVWPADSAYGAVYRHDGKDRMARRGAGSGRVVQEMLEDVFDGGGYVCR